MNIKRFLLLGIVTLYAIIPAWGQAQKVEIRGSVIDDEGEPAISIVIRDQNEKGDVYGITDLDGKFKIMADPSTTLHFSGFAYASKTVKLKGKTTINVVISYEASMIDEVVITAKKVVDKLLPEPTDIEIVGNQYIIHPKVKIPKEMYKPNTRIVVQPMLVNITRKTQSLFRPAVVTGKEYAITLERMMEFDLSRDPLAPFQEKTQKIDKNEVIAYVDSLYMDNPDDECRCDIYMYLVEYKKLAYKVTTKKRNAERYSDRIELQGFQSCFRLFVKPSQSPLKPNQDAATLLVRNHTQKGDKRTRMAKQDVKD